MSQAEYYRGLEAAARALAAGGDAAAVHRALAPLLADTPDRAARACHRGCAHCCHLPVGVTYPEAVRLFDAVQGNPDLLAAVVADAAATQGRTWRDLVGRPCPLLRDGACAVYDARPLPCRALASADATRCRAALDGGNDVPVDGVAFWRGLGAAAALASAPTAPGTRELRTAVAALGAVPPMAWPARFVASRRAGDPDEG